MPHLIERLDGKALAVILGTPLYINRTVNGEGCLECEKEFKSLLPQLAVLYYAGKNGLKAKLNDESAIGINLDTYIPSIGIAIETGEIRNSKMGTEEYGIKRLQCKKQGIDLCSLRRTLT